MEQRQFLTRLAVRHQRNVTDSVTGNYDTSWDSDDTRKLRMHLQAINEAFSRRVIPSGLTRAFHLVDGEVDQIIRAISSKGRANSI
jgi:hypothetical protein